MYDLGLGDFCTKTEGQLWSVTQTLSPGFSEVELKHDIAGCIFRPTCACTLAQFSSTALFLAILVLVSLEPKEV